MKLGTIVVLDSTVCRFLLILGSKGQGSGSQGHYFDLLAPFMSVERMQLQSSHFVQKMHCGRLLPADQKLCRNVPGVVQYI